jgi:hypothetical protein
METESPCSKPRQRPRIVEKSTDGDRRASRYNMPPAVNKPHNKSRAHKEKTFRVVKMKSDRKQRRLGILIL